MLQADGPPIVINQPEDIEVLRDYYNKLGGAKLVHSETIKLWRENNGFHKNFFNESVLSTARQWLADDRPEILHLENYDSEDSPEFYSGVDLYEFAKFIWLAKDLRINEPINIPQAHLTNNDIVIHPGSVTNIVRDYLNIDFEFMLWSSGDEFDDIPVLSFEEWADLIPIPNKSGTWSDNKASDHYYTELHYSEHAIEIWINSGFRKQMYEFYNNFHSKVSNNVKIYIGYDSKHSDASKVCEKSIRRYNQEIPIEFLDINKIPEYKRKWDKQTTEFTYSRFLVPWLMDYNGVGIFCDDDFVWNCDPIELLYSLDSDKAVSVVKHNFKKDLSGKKLDGQENIMYPKKLWSSLMMFNCGHSDCSSLTPEVVNNKSGQWLHQFYWTKYIGDLPHTYNWCEGSCDYCTEAFGTIDDAKAIHYTRGGPWLPGNWDHIQGLEHWNKVG